MSEKQTEKTTTFVCPFTGKKVTGVPAPAPVVPVDPNIRDDLGLELDKETGNTVIVVKGKRDQDKEIQEFKDDCGFEGMRKLLAQGRALPRDFYDDGKSGMDLSGLPDNVHDAFRAALASGAKKDQMLKDLGVDESDGIDDTEARIKAAVESYFKNLANQANNEVSKDETK